MLRLVRSRNLIDSRFLALPTFLGGLEYPSDRSDKRIWRKWVPKTIKKVASALASPNEGFIPVIARSLMDSRSWISKHNVETRVDFLYNLLDELPSVKDSKPHYNVGMFEMVDDDTPIGLITWDTLKEYAQEHPRLGPLMGTDRNGNPHTHPEWRGKRFFRRKIETSTPFMSLIDLLNKLKRDDTLRGLLAGNRKMVPYFTYKDHCHLRKKNYTKIVETIGEKQVAGTPLVKFESFWKLRQRIDEVSGTLWVHENNPNVKLLLSLSGDLRVEL
jgi:hypothetical protein